MCILKVNKLRSLHCHNWGFALLLASHISFGTSHVNKEPKTIQMPQTVITSNLSKDNEFAETNLETGLEFLENDDVILNINKQFFFGTDLLTREHRDNVSAFTLIQMFVRNIKGLPLEKTIYNGSIGGKINTLDKPDWSHNPHALKQLVKTEFKIYEILKQYTTKQLSNQTLHSLKSYLADFEASSLQAKRNLEVPRTKMSEDPATYIVSHPILTFRMIHRFSEDLEHIFSQLEPDCGNLKPEIVDLMLPSLEDLKSGFMALSRLQIQSGLNTYELAKGILENIVTGIQMNALNSLELGAFYITEGHYDLAMQWIHFATELVQKSLATKKYPEILEFYENVSKLAVKKHNNNFKTRLTHLWNPGIFNTLVQLPFVPSLYTRRVDDLTERAASEMNKLEWNWAILANFNTLCSGKNLQSLEEIAKLKCWYQHKSNYYWLIHPLKTEQLKIDPPVFQIYDVLGESFMEKMKSTVTPKLGRSRVLDGKNSSLKYTMARTSSQYFLSEKSPEGNFTRKFTKRLELVSGLIIGRPMASEPYQVACYGPSHHYEAHVDAYRDPKFSKLKEGNRLTTIMGYMSDVQVGGRTAFPTLGMFAEPVKGSIVVWNNLMRNGETIDYRTWHGGCPVVQGIKWITNKWVLYKQNWRTYSCTLNPNE